MGMWFGHVLALVGAILAILGGVVFDWQHFNLAEVTTKGYMVPPAGQIVVGLAALIACTSLAGLLTRKRKQFATATLIVSVFAIAWVVVAHVTRSTSFVLQPYETVELLGGYTMAVWGALIMFFGSLVTLASEPALDPNSEFLRVALIWNGTVIQEKVLQEPQTFNIGEDIRNDFIIPADKLPSKFPLFRAGKKGKYAIGLTNELDGQVTINQQTEPITEYIKKSTDNRGGVNFVPIEHGDWGMLHLDEMQVFFQFVRPDGKAAKRGFMAFDEYVTAAVSVSFFIQIGFLLMAIFTWDEQAVRVVKKNKKKVPKVEVVINELKEEEEPLEEEEEDDSTSKKAEGEEGKFGDPEEDPEKESKVPKNEGKMVDKIDPKKVGLNDLLSTDKLGGAGAIANILNSNTDGFSNKIAVAMAGTGSEFVMGHGAGGLGFKGTGSGGGGEGGYGRIHGMGKIDTGGGMGVKAGLGKKGKKRVGKIKLGAGASQGFCKKGNISSVVRRRAGAIRACYEQRLQLKPNLKGKLTVRWTIKMDGKVSGVSATKNSVGDSTVSNCVMRVVRRMRFQKPEGGICVVQWPFVFSAGG